MSYPSSPPSQMFNSNIPNEDLHSKISRYLSLVPNLFKSLVLLVFYPPVFPKTPYSTTPLHSTPQSPQADTVSRAQPAPLQQCSPSHCLQSNRGLKPECVAASRWIFICGFHIQIKSLQAQLPFSSPLNNTGSQHHSPKWSALCAFVQFVPLVSLSMPAPQCGSL